MVSRVPNGCPSTASPQSMIRGPSPSQQMLPSCRSSWLMLIGTPEAASSAHHPSYAGSSAASRSACSASRPPSSTGRAASSARSSRAWRGSVVGLTSRTPLARRASRWLGEGALGPGVRGDHGVPALPQLLRSGERAQHRPGVTHQGPAAVGVEGQHLGHEAGYRGVEGAGEAGLVGGAGAVHLEPQPAAVGLEPDRARPRSRVRLLPLSGEGEATVGSGSGRPRGGLLDERR